MAQSRTVTVNTTELNTDEIEGALNARYGRKGWTTEYIWETGRNSRQPRLKVVRSKTVNSAQ